jgi:hypothetical protein
LPVRRIAFRYLVVGLFVFKKMSFRIFAFRQTSFRFLDSGKCPVIQTWLKLVDIRLFLAQIKSEKEKYEYTVEGLPLRSGIEGL